MTEQRKLTALVVDDHTDSRDVLVKTLSLSPGLNLRIIEAVNGQDAYDKVVNESPDILYTGVKMPVMTGADLLQRLINERKIRPTFIVSASIETIGGGTEGSKALTLSRQMYTDSQMGYIDEKVRGTNYTLGFTGVLKPFDHKDIVNRTKIVQEMLYKGIK